MSPSTRRSATALAFLSFFAAARAQITPTAPGPGAVFRVGGSCSTQWTLDPSKTWDSFDIDLMSGSNSAMTVITRVADSMDGTSGVGTFSFPCPAVTPNSAIYFLQFTQGGLDPQWTTRFTIASSSGAVTPPANAVQADGSAIPWGTGALADGTIPSTVAGVMPDSASAASTVASMTSASATRMVTMTSASPSASASAASSSSSAVAVGNGQNLSSTTSGPFFESWTLGAKIGLLVGVIAGALILLGLFAFLLVRLCRRRKAASTSAAPTNEKKSTNKRGLKALALNSPSRAALTSRSRKGSKTSHEDSDDGGLDFKDEDDSYNTSLADLHAAAGRAPYVPASQQGQAITTDHEEREELSMSQVNRQSVFIAPEENFAGRGVPVVASPGTPRMSFEAPAFAAYQAAQAARARPHSATEVDGYTPNSMTSRQDEAEGYDWRRATKRATQNDWVQAHQGRK